MTRATRRGRAGGTRRAVGGPPRGVTMVELIVVLTILGVMMAVAGLTMQTAAPRPVPDAAAARVTALRDSALASGRVVTATIEAATPGTSGTRVGTVTAYPDGRVLTDVAHVDRVTGRFRARER